MPDIDEVIKGLECCAEFEPDACDECPYNPIIPCNGCDAQLSKDAIALLKAQKSRYALEVHNIGNVDIPDGVTFEQFQAVMTNVIRALAHTDRGESWPYESEGENNA